MANHSHIRTAAWPTKEQVEEALTVLARERFRGLLQVRYFGLTDIGFGNLVHEWEMVAADPEPDTLAERIGFLVWLHASASGDKGCAIELRHPWNRWARHAQRITERALAHRFGGRVTDDADGEECDPDPVDRCRRCHKAEDAHRPGPGAACRGFEPDTYAAFVAALPEERRAWFCAQVPKGLEDV